MEKITEKQTEVGTVMSEVSGCPMPQLDPRVVEVYKGVNKGSNICFLKLSAQDPNLQCIQTGGFKVE